MTDLFRFVALRAASSEPPKDPVDLSSDSKFQQELASIRKAQDGSVIGVARRVAAQFIGGAFGPGFLAATATVPEQAAFEQFAVAAVSAKDIQDLAKAVQAAFGKTLKGLVADPVFISLCRDVRDTIVAVIIVPEARSLALADLARLARLMALIVRAAAGDQSLGQPGAIQQALTATLLLPTAVFPLRTDLPQPVGVGDLLVVRQQLKRYEPGDVANIENILRGENREKVNTHDLTTDTTTITETSRTTETTTSPPHPGNPHGPPPGPRPRRLRPGRS